MKPANPPTHEKIAARAYELFLARGGAHGHHADDWGQAERELLAAAARFNVVLVRSGNNKIGLVKELRDITGLDLADVKRVVEGAPSTVKESVPQVEAERIRDRLTGTGAEVELR